MYRGGGQRYLGDIDRLTGSNLCKMKQFFDWVALFLVMWALSTVLLQKSPAHNDMAKRYGYDGYGDMMRDIYPKILGNSLGSTMRICSLVGDYDDAVTIVESLAEIPITAATTLNAVGQGFEDLAMIVSETIRDIRREENYFSRRLYWGAKFLVIKIKTRFVNFISEAYGKIDPISGLDFSAEVLLQYIRDGVVPVLRTVEQVDMMGEVLDKMSMLFTDDVDWGEVEYDFHRGRRPLQKMANMLKVMIDTGQLAIMMDHDPELKGSYHRLKALIGGETHDDFIERAKGDLGDYAAFDGYRTQRGWKEILPPIATGLTLDPLFGKCLTHADYHLCW